MKPGAGVAGRLARMLDRLVKSERLPDQQRTDFQNRIVEQVRSLPHAGILTTLREVIGNNNRRRRMAAVVLEELLDSPEVLPHLGQFVDDSDPLWRAWLVETIEESRLMQFADSLSRLMTCDPDLLVRQLAIHASGTLQAEANLPALLRLAENHPPELRGQVLWALKNYAREPCREFLAQVFADPCEGKAGRLRAQWGVAAEDRILAAWGLGKLADSRAITHLAQTLETPCQQSLPSALVLRAAQALCDIHGWPFQWRREAIAMAIARWQERPRQVRSLAAQEPRTPSSTIVQGQR